MDIYAESGIDNLDADVEGGNWRRAVVCSTPCRSAFRVQARNNGAISNERDNCELDHGRRHCRTASSLTVIRWIRDKRLAKNELLSTLSLIGRHPEHRYIAAVRVLSAHRLTKIRAAETPCFEGQASKINGQDHRSARRWHRRQFC
ncbi:hypothetical protein [Paraburkholderia caribensis]|uniref:hypothetical protein n=1 Tax=Paraburkholderia caribensis TaxID=75105 RepID=UPI001590385F|nr:hypothetical protein [Paraburkholderia caribensis]